tara:strand:+ start:53382 stop:53789 length:408 start_codon:yes stop_codon:yes gene_type:complete
MIYLVTTLSILLFILFFFLLNVVKSSVQALRTCNMAMSTITNPDLDDEEKENIVQRASLSLLKSFASILFRSLLSLGGSVAPILAFDYFNYVPMQATYDFMSRLDVIIIATAIVTLLYLFARLFQYTRARLCPSK